MPLTFFPTAALGIAALLSSSPEILGVFLGGRLGAA